MKAMVAKALLGFGALLLLFSWGPVSSASCPPYPTYDVELRIISCANLIPGTYPTPAEFISEEVWEYYGDPRGPVPDNAQGVMLIADLVDFTINFDPYRYSPGPRVDSWPTLSDTDIYFAPGLASCNEVAIETELVFRLSFACCDVLPPELLPCVLATGNTVELKE